MVVESLARQSDEPPERRPSDRREESAAEAGSGRHPPRRPRPLGRVLIVDDSPDVSEMYSLYFRARGYRAATAADGDAGVELAVRLRPDVIIMDIGMPTVDGLAATQQLKRDRRTRHIPVVILTGYHYRGMEGVFLELDVARYLTKPCLPQDLEAHVRQIIQDQRRRTAPGMAPKAPGPSMMCAVCRRDIPEGTGHYRVGAARVHPECLRNQERQPD